MCTGCPDRVLNVVSGEANAAADAPAEPPRNPHSQTRYRGFQAAVRLAPATPPPAPSTTGTEFPAEVGDTASSGLTVLGGALITEPRSESLRVACCKITDDGKGIFRFCLMLEASRTLAPQAGPRGQVPAQPLTWVPVYKVGVIIVLFCHCPSPVKWS